jgi:hypothetical protein
MNLNSIHHPTTNISQNDTKNKIALAAIATSMIGTAALTFPFIIMQLRSPLPYMSTPKKKILAALEEISKRKYSSLYQNDKKCTGVLTRIKQNQSLFKQNIKTSPLRFLTWAAEMAKQSSLLQGV